MILTYFSYLCETSFISLYKKVWFRIAFQTSGFRVPPAFFSFFFSFFLLVFKIGSFPPSLPPSLPPSASTAYGSSLARDWIWATAVAGTGSFNSLHRWWELQDALLSEVYWYHFSEVFFFGPSLSFMVCCFCAVQLRFCFLELFFNVDLCSGFFESSWGLVPQSLQILLRIHCTH